MLDLQDLPSLPWLRAMNWFDDGDPSIVEALILSGEPIQIEVRKFLADIVTGKRKPPTMGKARKVLNADHKELLRKRAMVIVTVRKVASQQLLKAWKQQAIDEVVERSGASRGTVEQAWKVAWQPWARRARSNQRFLLAAKTERERRDGLEKLRELRRKNDPFSGG